ncbi:MAG: tetratricopeptide repeat protein [Verrucomicrobiota bacterium]
MKITRIWKAVISGALAVVMASTSVLAQNPVPAAAGELDAPMGATGDPSDIWLQAYLLLRNGEEQEEAGENLQALSKYREAQKLFDYIVRTEPNWKPEMMEFRRKNLLDRVHGVQEKLAKNNTPLPQPDTPPVQPTQFGDPKTIRIPGAGDAGGQNMTQQQPVAPIQPQPAPTNPGTWIDQQFAEKNRLINELKGANITYQEQIQAKDQTITNLQTELQKAGAQQQTMQKQLAAAADEISKARGMSAGEKKEMEMRMELMAGELAKANEESAEIIEALKKAQDEAAELRRENNAIQAANAGMSENGAQVVIRLKEAEAARDKARQERDQAKTTLAEITKQRDDLQKKADELQEMSDSDKGELTKELTETKEQLAAMNKAIEEMTKGRDGVTKKLEEELTKNGELTEQNKKLLAELGKAQQTMTALNTKVADLEKERDLLKQDNANLERERNMLVKQRNDLQEELDEYAILINANEQIDGDVKEMVAAKRKWQKEIAALQDQVNEMAKKEGDYQNQISDLKGQLKKIQDERQKLQEDNAVYAERVEELNGKLKGMLAELDNKNSALETANENLANLTKEREDLQKQLDAAQGDMTGGQKRMVEMEKELAEAREQVVMLGHSEEENDLLRGIIRRQLVKQARLKESRDLVLAELQKLDMETSKVQEHVIQMANTNVFEFSEEELGMFREKEDLDLIKAIENMDLLLPADMVGRAAAQNQGSKPSGSGNGENAVAGHAATTDTNGAKPATTPAAAGEGSTKIDNITHLAKSASYDFQQRNYKAAQKGYEHVLKLDRHNVFALCNLGVIHIHQKDLRSAKIQFERAIAHRKDCAPAHYFLGVVRYRERDLDDALESFGECIKYREGHANAHNYIGLIASEKGWGTRAENEFKRAIDADPAHADAHFNLAVLYATRDQPSKDLAKQFYLKALQNGAARDAAMEQYIDA